MKIDSYYQRHEVGTGLYSSAIQAVPKFAIAGRVTPKPDFKDTPLPMFKVTSTVTRDVLDR